MQAQTINARFYGSLPLMEAAVPEVLTDRSSKDLKDKTTKNLTLATGLNQSYSRLVIEKF